MNIDLRKIQTCISTCEGLKWLKRKEELLKLLKENDFEKVKVFEGKISTPYMFGANDNIRNILEDNRLPFLLLEDDARIIKENYKSVIDVRNECDILYLGGVTHANIHFVTQDTTILRNNILGLWNSAVFYKPIDQNYVRIYNMFSGHAILFLTERGREQYLNAINTYKNQPFDVTFAQIMPNLNVYMVKDVMFFQDDEKNKDCSKIVLSLAKAAVDLWRKAESVVNTNNYSKARSF